MRAASPSRDSQFPRDIGLDSWKILRLIMKKLLFCCVSGLALALVAAMVTPARAADATNAPAAAKEVAIIKTTEGDMVLEFWPEAAPKTVANFKKLAKDGFYDGTAFHRVVKGFMIQGGDPNTKNANAPDTYGTGGPHYTIPDEFNDHAHVRGVISMAHTGAPNSGGSQFFICLADAPGLNHKFSAFGKLIKGDDVLGKIGDTACTGPNAMGEMAIPKTRIGVISIKIVPVDSVK